MSLPVSGKNDVLVPKGSILVDQQDLYTNIFSTFSNCDLVTDKYIVFVLTEYIRSLTQYRIPVQHYIYELVIHAMVRQKAFYQLHQFMQNYVVNDSKHLVSCKSLQNMLRSVNFNLTFSAFYCRHVCCYHLKENTRLLIS